MMASVVCTYINTIFHLLFEIDTMLNNVLIFFKHANKCYSFQELTAILECIHICTNYNWMFNKVIVLLEYIDILI